MLSFRPRSKTPVVPRIPPQRPETQPLVSARKPGGHEGRPYEATRPGTCSLGGGCMLCAWVIEIGLETDESGVRTETPKSTHARLRRRTGRQKTGDDRQKTARLRSPV